MSNPLGNLEPRELWSRFNEIRQIPRPSKHEEKIRQYVLGVASRYGLETRTDAAGNVVVAVPATPGAEEAPTVVLQGHLDMVCEKNEDKEHDFWNDPIELILEGDRLTADGTTLGADNGIAVAAALALIDRTDVRHGPLELLFTVDEETGLTGATQLDPSLLEGRLLINLDSEEDGVVTIGCAGGRTTTLKLLVERQESSTEASQIRVAGLRGGHSGGDIHLERANAIKTLVRILRRLEPGRLVSIRGGSAHNAIPREAFGVVAGAPDEIRAAISAIVEEIRSDFAEDEPKLEISVKPAPTDVPPLTPASAETLLGLLVEIPHGVLGMSHDLPDLVETSNNLATVRTSAAEVEILLSSRSSVASALSQTVDTLHEIASEFEAQARSDRGYPGWRPDPESRLLALAIRVYQRLFGHEPKVRAVHAGLECGIIGEKIPGMDMISIGPDIRNPHSPFEEISVSSTQRMLGELLDALLEELATAPAS